MNNQDLTPILFTEIKDAGLIERTVIRPLKRFLKTDCNFFYNGAVPHPSGPQ
jgi:hypothetical protein